VRLIAFTAALLASTACSAEPRTQAQTQAGAKAATAPGDVTQGPQGPQVAGSNAPVPKNAPAPTARNVPATTGRANIAATAPPVTITAMGQFGDPFSIAFLPDARLLVTEKVGALKLRAADGRVSDIAGVPTVAGGGQGGLLDVAPAPDFATSRTIYLSYAEPRPNGGSSLALMRARLDGAGLRDQRVIWRAGSDGPGGQFGAVIAFAPDGKSLFLTSGERQRFTPAQDPEQALGKILRLTLDGAAWPGNPMFKAGGVRAMTWSSGHRNPYGLVFASDGRLWEEEMGPRGGDELNLIQPGKNYGWPLVSNGDNYSGVEIPDHPSRPEFQPPVLWWNPVISPGGMIAYTGAMFPAYRGSLFIAGLSSKSLVRVAVNGDQARSAEQWNMGERIRDVAQAPDGAIWVIQDDGKLLRLTPKS
jgi:glucose/arabinose dehydrogenase